MASVSVAPVSPEALERAGLRLERATMDLGRLAAKMTVEEEEFGSAEGEFMKARTAYRAMIESFTGVSADTLERRLTA